MTIRVSVVVPTCRRTDLLRRCLAALAAQDFDPAEFEIIVADDAAATETRRLVEGGGWLLTGSGGHRPPSSPFLVDPETRRAAAFWRTGPAKNRRPVESAKPAPAQQPGSSWLHERDRNGTDPEGLSERGLETYHALRTAHYAVGEREPDGRRVGPALVYVPVVGPHGPAAARNAGWRVARGEIIAFTDDDCIPAPGWLHAGLAAFRPGVHGVAGRILMPLEGTPTDYELNATGLQRSEFVTANCFYRREVLEAVGGFDERFTAAWREDTDLFFSALELAEKAGDPPWSALVAAMYTHVPDALVLHPVRPASWGISVRQQRKNMFNALLYKKHPMLYQQRIQVAPPWSYYVTLAALLAGTAGAIGGQSAVALAGLAGWLGLTWGFCRRRLRGTSHAPAHVAEMVLTSALIPPLAVFWRLVGAVRYRTLFL